LKLRWVSKWQRGNFQEADKRLQEGVNCLRSKRLPKRACQKKYVWHAGTQSFFR
jgi:hypothetical protein